MKDLLMPARPADVIDQVIILQDRIASAVDQSNRRRLVQQINGLQAVIAQRLSGDAALDALRGQLADARRDVQVLEKDMRNCEAQGMFGPGFVALARAYLSALDDLEAAKMAFDQRARDIAQPVTSDNVTALRQH